MKNSLSTKNINDNIKHQFNANENLDVYFLRRFTSLTLCSMHSKSKSKFLKTSLETIEFESNSVFWMLKHVDTNIHETYIRHVVSK